MERRTEKAKMEYDDSFSMRQHLGCLTFQRPVDRLYTTVPGVLRLRSFDQLVKWRSDLREAFDE